MKDDSTYLVDTEDSCVFLNMDIPRICESEEELIEMTIDTAQKAGIADTDMPYMISAPNISTTKMIIAAGFKEFTQVEVTMTYNALLMGVPHARTRH